MKLLPGCAGMEASLSVHTTLVCLLGLCADTAMCCVEFEVFTAATVKDAVFWDVATCRSCVNRRFGGTCRLHPQVRKIHQQGTSFSRWLQTEPPVENRQLYKNGGRENGSRGKSIARRRLGSVENVGSLGEQVAESGPEPVKNHSVKGKKPGLPSGH
jgi:hypothetical protein